MKPQIREDASMLSYLSATRVVLCSHCPGRLVVDHKDISEVLKSSIH
jgi:hypothetical protein